jgi:hypothetical protein
MAAWCLHYIGIGGACSMADADGVRVEEGNEACTQGPCNGALHVCGSFPASSSRTL